MNTNKNHFKTNCLKFNFSKKNKAVQHLSDYKGQSKMLPPCRKYIKHTKLLIDKVTWCFENYIFPQTEILQHMNSFTVELGKRFEAAISIMFSLETFKKVKNTLIGEGHILIE